MERYAKWSIASGIFWVLFFVVLFTGIVHKTSLFHEYSCEVRDFHVDPRFECYKRCSIIDAGEPLVPASSLPSSTPSSSYYLSADDAAEIMAELERENVAVSEEEFLALLQSVENGNNKDGNKGDKGGKGDEKNPEKYPDCDQLERDTLDFYSPRLCLNARWGFEDPLCPQENAPCYTGNKWRRKCGLYCPLAYNVTVTLDVDHIGTVQKARDLGTDHDRYLSYKDGYKRGNKLSCQVVKDITGNHDILFLDERMSHETLQWWKWSLFSGSLFLALFTTTAAVVSSYRRFRVHRDGYDPVINPLNPASGDE